MKKLISYYRCSNCKNPLKHLLVEECPKCGKKLVSNVASKRIGLLAIFTFIGIFLAAILLFLDKREINPVVILSASSIVAIPILTIIGYLYFRNKRNMSENKEFIGTGMTAEFEYHLTYIDTSHIKLTRFIIIPAIPLSIILIVMFLLVVDLGYFDFLPSDDFPNYFILLFILLFIFAITGFYSAHLYGKEIKKITKEFWE